MVLRFAFFFQLKGNKAPLLAWKAPSHPSDLPNYGLHSKWFLSGRIFSNIIKVKTFKYHIWIDSESESNEPYESVPFTSIICLVIIMHIWKHNFHLLPSSFQFKLQQQRKKMIMMLNKDKFIRVRPLMITEELLLSLCLLPLISPQTCFLVIMLFAISEMNALSFHCQLLSLSGTWIQQ